MVHALEEIGRVLATGGVLVDLRPLSDRWPVELLSARGNEEVGRVTDLARGLAEDAAANEAMSHGERAGLFRREAEATFPFYYIWDSPRDMQTYIQEEWADFNGLEEDVWRRLRSRWAVAEADARVGIRVKMLISRWIKAV